MYTKTLILWMYAAATAAGATRLLAADKYEQQGRALFFDCEFKRAGQAFEKASAAQPERADLYYWLGKTYERLADTSSLLTARKWARKAGHNLEDAVRLDPRNEEYVQELFNFYVDSPEWFGGGLKRAQALVENTSVPAISAARIAASREEHSGAPWWTRAAILRTGSVMGALLPAR